LFVFTDKDSNRDLAKRRKQNECVKREKNDKLYSKSKFSFKFHRHSLETDYSIGVDDVSSCKKISV
jgi:hypothetical protein